MPKRYKIELSDEERTQLERWVKNPPQPYLRERARAILGIASGRPIREVALRLRIRIHRTAVSEWVQRFEQERVEGLKIKPGRGRKPGFSPSGKAGSQGRD